jgi:hypothetical protein
MDVVANISPSKLVPPGASRLVIRCDGHGKMANEILRVTIDQAPTWRQVP